MTFILLLSICGILQISSGQYYYDKPGIKFQTDEKFGPTSDHVGYDYPKPNIPFEYSKSTKEPTTSLYDILNRQTPPDSFAHGNVYSAPKEQFSTSTERIFEKQEHGVGYQYPKPKQQLKLPNKVGSTSPGYQYQKPKVPFELPSIKPTAVATHIAHKNENTFNTNAEYQYPQDRSSLSPLSSQYNGINPTKGFVTPLINPGIKSGYQYSKPQSPLLYTQKEIYKGGDGYVYPKPPNPLVLPGLTTSTFSAEKPVRLSTTPRPTNPVIKSGYQYTKPQSPLLYPQKEIYKGGEGYVYPKPPNPLVLPGLTTSSLSTEKPVRLSTTPRPTNPGIKSGYQYSKPQSPLLYPQKEIYKGGEGYVYPKPPNPLVLPGLTTSSLSTEKPVRLSTTPRPTNPTYKNGEGYVYSKPDKSFILPTPTSLSILKTVKPTTLVSKKSKGYVYEIPINPLTTEEPFILSITMKPSYPIHKNQQGYNYPKPENPLIITRPAHSSIKITTTTEKQHISTTTLKTNPSLLSKGEHLSKPKQGYEYPKPSIPFNTNPIIPEKSPNKSNGYNYPKPAVSFEPERINEIPREAISGYKYPKPTIPFEI